MSSERLTWRDLMITFPGQQEAKWTMPGTKNGNGSPSGIRQRTQVTITPELAKHWLEANTKNRPINRRIVDRYAAEIKDGRWKYNGDAIKFGWDNVLLDGQHRLLAIVQAQRPIVSDVVLGLDPSVFATLDTGKLRSGGDALAVSGFSDYHNLAAALKLQYIYERGAITEGTYASHLPPGKISEIANLHPKMVDAVKLAYQAKNVLVVSVGAFLAYQFGKIDEDLCSEFFAALKTGSDLAPGDPILTLRNRLMVDRTGSSRTKKLWAIAYTIKAWNAMRTDQPLTRLTWRSRTPDEPMPEIL